MSNTDDLPPPPPSKKPRISAQDTSSSSDLISRLNAFLPQLSAANERLNAKEMSMENVGEEEEAYIEMNLGLGVLEEIRSDDSGSDGSSEDESSSRGEDESIMADLLNSSKRHGKGPRGKPNIEEVVDTAATPTPHHPKYTKGGYQAVREHQLLADVLKNSKKHGKAPHGKPSIEEVEETAHTPTPETRPPAERAKRDK